MPIWNSFSFYEVTSNNSCPFFSCFVMLSSGCSKEGYLVLGINCWQVNKLCIISCLVYYWNEILVLYKTFYLFKRKKQFRSIKTIEFYMHSLAFSALLTPFHLSQALESLKKKIASMHMDEEMSSSYFFFFLSLTISEYKISCNWTWMFVQMIFTVCKV